MRGFLVAGALLGLFSGMVHAADGVTLGASSTYAKGDYGTGQETKLWYAPVTAKLDRGPLQVKVTVPYLRVDSAGVQVSGGQVIGTGSAAASRREGLGDIWVQGKYKQALGAVKLVPYGKVKLPTAAAGLGTGKTDVEAGLGVEGAIGTRLFPFAQAGYRWVGSPADRNLQNITTFNAGVTGLVSAQHALTLMYAGRGSTTPGFADSRDATLAYSFLNKQGPGLMVALGRGLADGSPDTTVTVGTSIRF